METEIREGRRFFLSAFVPGAVLATVAFATGQQRVPPQSPQQARQNGQHPAPVGLPGPSKVQMTENQKALRKDVDDLFTLAQDLKSQADKMDTTNVLSVSFLDSAEKIEKLAKKIRELARY